MLRHLGLLADGKWFILDGYDLLFIMDDVVKGAFASNEVDNPKEGSGSLDSPFRMDKPSQWRWLGRKSEGQEERFYKIGGRTIFKDKKNYTSDRGLVSEFKDGNAVLSGSFGKADGPSYKEYMNYVVILNEEIEPHQRLAEMCFNMLRDKPPPLPSRVATEKPRAWQVLPVLTATMFISESIRNNRSFATNLMLLELIQMGATYGLQAKEYSLAKAVWNPADHALGHDDHTLLVRPKVDVYGKTMAEKVSDLHLVGGKGAMTQKDAVSQAKPLLRKAIEETRPNMTYAQQKEVSLLLHWLNAKGGPWVPRNALVERAKLMPEDFVLPFAAVTSATRNPISNKLKQAEERGVMTSMQRGKIADSIVEIRKMIKERITVI